MNRRACGGQTPQQGRGVSPHALALPASTGHSDHYQFVVEDILMSTPGQGGTENPNVRSDMVFFEMPNGGAVFAVGSIQAAIELHLTYTAVNPYPQSSDAATRQLTQQP